jgi:hypothetical protein
VVLAEGANQRAGGKAAAVLDTLGAAYAEAGRYGEAVGAAQGALGLAQAAGQTESARQIEARLRLYQAGRPYHEGSARKP